MSLTVVLTILAMLFLNGIFAAYELALASVRLDRLKVLAEKKRRGAATALRMKNRMEGSLAVDRSGLHVRREEGGLRFSHRGAAFLLRVPPPSSGNERA